jgi:hypothetical protein
MINKQGRISDFWLNYNALVKNNIFKVFTLYKKHIWFGLESFESSMFFLFKI